MAAALGLGLGLGFRVRVRVRVRIRVRVRVRVRVRARVRVRVRVSSQAATRLGATLDVAQPLAPSENLAWRDGGLRLQVAQLGHDQVRASARARRVANARRILLEQLVLVDVLG